MKKIIAFALAGQLLFPAVTLAAALRGGENISINSAETIEENAYLAGSNLSLSGTVLGDLLAAGGTVNLSGAIDKDLTAAGGTLNLNGFSAEDVRIAGGTLNLSGTIRGELMAAGGEITVAPETSITRSSWLGGGTIRFNGKTDEPLTIAGGTVYVNGAISGDLTVFGENIELGPNASVGGNFNYKSSKEANIDPKANIAGRINFEAVESKNAGKYVARGFVGVMSLIKFLSFLLVSLIIFWLWRNETEAALASSSKIGKEMLRGFAILFLVPIAALFSAFTIIGILPAFMVILLYIVITLLASAFSSILVGSWLVTYAWKREPAKLRWYDVLLGAIVLAVISWIPIVGWLACFAVFLVSLGTTSHTLAQKVKTSRG